MLIENIAPTLDLAMFSTAPEVPDLRPAGILAGVGALTSAGSMAADLAQIANSLAPVAGSGGAMLVAAPKQWVSLMLAPRDVYPLYQSAALPDGTVIGIVPSGLATVVSTPRIEASGAATMHRADPASDITDIGGVLATPVYSLFQIDATNEKCIVPATWARRSPAAVAWIHGATW